MTEMEFRERVVQILLELSSQVHLSSSEVLHRQIEDLYSEHRKDLEKQRTHTG